MYSINPYSQGNYFSNNVQIPNSNDKTRILNPFDNSNDVVVQNKNVDILEVAARKTVPERMESVGTSFKKSCNLSGITINRFENPHCNTQNPNSIIIDESFRGGVPSRMVEKDNFVRNKPNRC